MASPAELVVVGAGIIGTAIARELQARGLRCLLLDRGAPGHGTSFGNAGHIAVEQSTPLAQPGAWRETPALLLGRGAASLRWRDAASVLPWSAAFVRNCSAQRYAVNHRAFRALQSNTAADWRALGMACPAVAALTQFRGHDEIFESTAARRSAQPGLMQQREESVNWRELTAEELQALRALAPRAVAGVRYEDSGYVKTPLGIVEALYEDFCTRGGRFLHADIRLIEPNGGGFILKTCGAPIHARRVVVTTGAHSARLLEPLGLRVPLIAERGYHLSFARHLAGLERPLLLRERAAVLTPMSFGFRCTSFVEFASPGSAPTPPNGPGSLDISKRPVFIATRISPSAGWASGQRFPTTCPPLAQAGPRWPVLCHRAPTSGPHAEPHDCQGIGRSHRIGQAGVVFGCIGPGALWLE